MQCSARELRALLAATHGSCGAQQGLRRAGQPRSTVIKLYTAQESSCVFARPVGASHGHHPGLLEGPGRPPPLALPVPTFRHPHPDHQLSPSSLSTMAPAKASVQLIVAGRLHSASLLRTPVDAFHDGTRLLRACAALFHRVGDFLRLPATTLLHSPHPNPEVLLATWATHGPPMAPQMPESGARASSSWRWAR